jgi:hypothetical protein
MDHFDDVHVVKRVSRTYNVYRGTSPTTQNRLEVRTPFDILQLTILTFF